MLPTAYRLAKEQCYLVRSGIFLNAIPVTYLAEVNISGTSLDPLRGASRSHSFGPKEKISLYLHPLTINTHQCPTFQERQEGYKH
jgi:hypothetical protein